MLFALTNHDQHLLVMAALVVVGVLVVLVVIGLIAAVLGLFGYRKAARDMDDEFKEMHERLARRVGR